MSLDPVAALHLDVVVAEDAFLFVPPDAELTPCQWAHIDRGWFDTGTSEERGRIWRRRDDDDD